MYLHSVHVLLAHLSGKESEWWRRGCDLVSQVQSNGEFTQAWAEILLYKGGVKDGSSTGLVGLSQHSKPWSYAACPCNLET